MTKRSAAVLLALVLLVPAGAAEAASVPWSGYRIKPAPTADGGFMGARKTDGKVTYRLDASARRGSSEYKRAHRVSTNRGEARAAWIISKYGAVRVADQSAAVDVATYALVSGRPLGGRRAKARLRSTGHAASIRSLARYMLAESKKYAGPYTLAVRSRPAEVGGRVKVRVQVTSYAGLPVAKLPVLLRVPGVAEVHETSAKGRVYTSYPADQVGVRKLRVRVSRVPEWRLLVRDPRRKATSRIAIAGRKTELVARDVVVVRASPKVSVPSAPKPEQVDRAFSVGFTVTGSEGIAPRTATFSLFGPFPQGAQTGCDGTPIRTLTSEVKGDGTYAGPPAIVSNAGLYVWRVHVGANQLNAPTQACGGLVRVRSSPRFRLDAKPGSRLTFILSGLPTGYDNDAELMLFGPYKAKANATCYPKKKVGATAVRVNHNGSYTSPKIATGASGFYTWRVNLPAGYLVLPTRTACGAAGSFVKVP